jgi:site-specific DNA-methyltransferase (adenine-specific)
VQPYYQDGSVTLYHGDCREVLPTLHEIDAIITDPPYGIGIARWDNPVSWEALAAPLLKPSGFCVAFGLLRTLAPVVAALEAAGLELEQEMVWSRGTLGTAGERFGRSHELFTIHYLPPRAAPKVDRVRVPYAPASKPSRNHKRHPLGSAPGSVWYVHEESGSYARHEHESAKPVSLMQRIVSCLSDPGEIVLDPFAGSGSTLVAAKNLGRRAIGVELEERWCEVTARRLAQGVLPLEAA